MLRIYVYVEKSRNVGEIVVQKAYFKLHWGGRSNCAKLSQNNLVHTTASRSFFDWNLSRDFMSIKPFVGIIEVKMKSETLAKDINMICRDENIGKLKENIMFCPDVRRYRYIACTKRVAVTFLENFEWPLKIMTASTFIYFSHLQGEYISTGGPTIFHFSKFFKFFRF